MTAHVRVAGVWRESQDGPSVRVAGVDRNIDFGYVRVAGGWRECYVRDNTGPAAPSSRTATWTASGATAASAVCTVDWVNPPDADHHHVLVYRNRIGVSNDGLIATVNAPTSSYTDNDIREFGVVYRYTLYPVDARGNMGTSAYVDSMAFSGVARGAVASPITFLPTNSGTYRGSAWRTDSVVQSPWGRDSGVLQGYTASGMNYGWFVYNNQIYNTLRGTQISGMQLTLMRGSTSGLGQAVSPHVWAHGASTLPATGNTGFTSGSVLSPGIARNGSAPSDRTWTLPSAWHSNFESGAWRGVTLYDSNTVLNSLGASDEYMLVRGWDEFVLYQYTSGQITVFHSG